MMLDVHQVYDATGSTDTVVKENNVNAVIPSGDSATTIGLSPVTGAILVGYGANVGAAAQAIVSLGLTGSNVFDIGNGLIDTATGTDLAFQRFQFGQWNYAKGPNLVQYANEAAGKTSTCKMDLVNLGKYPVVQGSEAPFGLCQYSQTFGAATAGVILETAFNPSPIPPPGKYAILGVKASAMTAGGVLTFKHTDFGGAYPGFPIVDTQTIAANPEATMGSPFAANSWQGMQFVKVGQLLRQPVCPVFNIQGQGTGLKFELLDVIADTVSITLNLQPVP